MAKRRNRKRSGGIARQDYTQGGRVGYQRGKVVVDRETGEVLEDFKATPVKRPAPRPTPAPAPTRAPAPAPTRAPAPSTVASTAPDLPEVRSVSTPTTLDLDRRWL